MRKSLILFMISTLCVGLITGCSSAQPDTDEMGHDMGDMDMSSESMETGTSVEIGNLLIKDFWSRPSFEGDTGVVYMTIVNQGDTAQRLTGASTDMADSAEVHEVKMDGDVMHMQPVSELEIPAGGQLALEPGGYHLMLVNLHQDLGVGDTVKVDLSFGDETTVSLEVEVLQP